MEIRGVVSDLENSSEYSPIETEIQVRSLIKLPIANRILLLPGSHKVVLAAEGYQSQQQQLKIGEQKNQRIDVELLRLPGNIQLNAVNEQGEKIDAQVYLDDQKFTLNEGLLTNIEAGSYQLTVDAPLYRPQTRAILIKGKGLTEQVDLVLEPAWSQYHFSTNPESAEVFVDGVLSGKTPVSIKLEEGLRQN